MVAAKRFFGTMDKSGANKAAIDKMNTGRAVLITVGQVKYLNNIVERGQRAIKRITRPMRDFKAFWSACNVLDGIELMHMIRKGPFNSQGSLGTSFADKFYAVARDGRPV